MKKSIILTVIACLTNMVYATTATTTTTTTTTRNNKSNNTTTTTTTSFGSDAEVDAISASISAAFGVGSAFLAYHIINKPSKLSSLSSHYKNVVVDILKGRINVDITKEEYQQLLDFINKDPSVINTDSYIKVINDKLDEIRAQSEFFTANEYDEEKSMRMVEEEDNASSGDVLEDNPMDSENPLLTTEQMSKTVNSDALNEIKNNIHDNDEDNYTDKAELGDDDYRELEDDTKEFKPIE